MLVVGTVYEYCRMRSFYLQIFLYFLEMTFHLKLYVFFVFFAVAQRLGTDIKFCCALFDLIRYNILVRNYF